MDFDYSDRHPSVRDLMQFFGRGNALYGVMNPEFLQLVIAILERFPDSPELPVALRKLLEAKDCLKRADVMAKQQGGIVNPGDKIFLIGETGPGHAVPSGH
jgi:hypothetical protein